MDLRITAVGSRLRRWSVDELLQLFNMFLGHMSLVRPRPAVPDEAAKGADHVRRRLVVKLGRAASLYPRLSTSRPPGRRE